MKGTLIHWLGFFFLLQQSSTFGIYATLLFPKLMEFKILELSTSVEDIFFPKYTTFLKTKAPSHSELIS